MSHLAGTPTPLPAAAGRRPRGATRRRRAIARELAVAALICFAGYYFVSDWLRVTEAHWVVGVLQLCGVQRVSGLLPGHVLIFPAAGAPLNALVTPACSSILSVVGLTALTVAVLRSRRLHAFAALFVAVVLVLVLNDLRLVGSTLAGLWWGQNALVLFHDWAGTLWSFASTLAGFLLMVCVALPSAERAEQDVAGRHTARRPGSWARPGLGYRLPQLDGRTLRQRRTLTSLVYRFLLPGAVTRRLAAHREAGRIDYRIGHLSADQRAASVRALAADGLGVHTASLLAVATYEADPVVLDALAGAVAARQWEPVTNHRIAALRLWARGWMKARRTTAEILDVPGAAVAPPFTRPADPTAGGVRALEEILTAQNPALAPAVRVPPPPAEAPTNGAPTKGAPANAAPAGVGTVPPRTFARRSAAVPAGAAVDRLPADLVPPRTAEDNR